MLLLVSESRHHGEYADETDRQTVARHTVTLCFSLDATSEKMNARKNTQIGLRRQRAMQSVFL